MLEVSPGPEVDEPSNSKYIIVIDPSNPNPKPNELTNHYSWRIIQDSVQTLRMAQWGFLGLRLDFIWLWTGFFNHLHVQAISYWIQFDYYVQLASLVQCPMSIRFQERRVPQHCIAMMRKTFLSLTFPGKENCMAATMHMTPLVFSSRKVRALLTLISAIGGDLNYK